MSIKEVKELPLVKCVECNNQIGFKHSWVSGHLEDETQKCDWCFESPGWYKNKALTEKMEADYKKNCKAISVNFIGEE